ncbi:hypothetical protein ES332_D08G177400v1 [Gossypium tomentosum]|uniref:Uncharacterized protein n=1 Tax=Gossypium tomentosum TaxID=34277 RepID=A0A5D2JWS5_GOSTO|nr:hypothetical protein ES332_D08G177400v1 [Gossypium tomentosum]
MDVVHIVDTHGRCSNYCHGAAYSMFPMNIPCACYLIYCCSDLKFAWALVEVAREERGHALGRWPKNLGAGAQIAPLCQKDQIAKGCKTSGVKM